MCPTPIGRIHTRVATIIGPALIGLALSLITGREDWIVLIGVFLLLGVTLDAGLYSWVLKYQPPWMTGVLALFELGVLFALAQLFELNLTDAEAIIFYWVAWGTATATRIALLPIISLIYIESSGEFRRIQWSIPPQQASLPVIAAEDERAAAPGTLLEEASGVHAKPLELKPAPSGVQAVPSPPVTSGGQTPR
jgi:hypothetical protein